jgi:hypothetical protein
MRIGRTSPFPQTDPTVSYAVAKVTISLHYLGTEEAICDVGTNGTSIGLLSSIDKPIGKSDLLQRNLLGREDG